MNFLATGFREQARIIQRANDRILVWRERRRLTKAETDLGFLGWQQAEFSADVNEQVGAINAFEQQQYELANRSADLQSQIDGLHFRREQLRGEHREQAAHWESLLQPLLGAHAIAAETLSENRAKLRRFDKAIGELEAARDALDRELKRLMSLEQSRDVMGETYRIRNRIAAYENERDDLRRSRLAAAGRFGSAESEEVELNSKIAGFRAEMDAHKKAFALHETEVTRQIAAIEKEKGQITKLLESLDHKKSPAYLAIGRCLADCKIAPMNQPGALALVLHHREQVGVLVQNIASSLEESAAANRVHLVLFWLSCALLVLAVCAFARFR